MVMSSSDSQVPLGATGNIRAHVRRRHHCAGEWRRPTVSKRGHRVLFVVSNVSLKTIIVSTVFSSLSQPFSQIALGLLQLFRIFTSYLEVFIRLLHKPYDGTELHTLWPTDSVIVQVEESLWKRLIHCARCEDLFPER